MISQIKPDGTFRVVELGGWNPLVVSSQAFTLQLQDGRTIPAISGSVPPHLSRGANAPGLPAIADIIFDLVSNYDEAWAFGVRPGMSSFPK